MAVNQHPCSRCNQRKRNGLLPYLLPHAPESVNRFPSAKTGALRVEAEGFTLIWKLNQAESKVIDAKSSLGSVLGAGSIQIPTEGIRKETSPAQKMISQWVGRLDH